MDEFMGLSLQSRNDTIQLTLLKDFHFNSNNNNFIFNISQCLVQLVRFHSSFGNNLRFWQLTFPFVTLFKHDFCSIVKKNLSLTLPLNFYYLFKCIYNNNDRIAYCNQMLLITLYTNYNAYYHLFNFLPKWSNFATWIMLKVDNNPSSLNQTESLWCAKKYMKSKSELKSQVSISSTFYTRIFRTNFGAKAKT